MRLLPGCGPCWQSYGDVLENRKKHQQALIAYQKSIAIHPTDKTRQRLIVTLRSLGENRRADAMQRIVDMGKP
ncbi:MAG: tetratricopeptide repeat protein [Mariprofundus sp.]